MDITPGTYIFRREVNFNNKEDFRSTFAVYDTTGKELKSVKKKYKNLNFAADCSREVIQQGADMLGWELDDLISQTILAMRSLNPELGI